MLQANILFCRLNNYCCNWFTWCVVAGHGEGVDGDDGVGAEDDQLISQEIDQQHLRVNLHDPRVSVVKFLLARVDPNLVLRGRLNVKVNNFC